MIQYSMPPIIILVLLGSALVWMQESIFCLSRSQATQVFLVLACLPTVAVWMSVRSLHAYLGWRVGNQAAQKTGFSTTSTE